MKKLLLSITFLGIITVGISQELWKKNGIHASPPVCYGSDKVHQSYVPPPYELLNRLKSTGQQNANIIVTYDDAFEADPTAKAAFQAAVDIWEGLISSSVPIHLYAYWSALGTRTLGNCGPWEYYENLDFMPFKDTFYPVALVEKMTGEEITDGATPDIVAHFNKNNNNWYFGTDGKTPATKYDFMSVVLHEIAHGLGYVGMAKGDTVNDIGSFQDYATMKSFPAVFDKYLMNGFKKYLSDTNSYKNPSVSLYYQFISSNISFGGQIPYEDGGKNAYPRIYAPFPEFESGSSLYHLNESTYLEGTVNSLMTPAVDKGEAIHDPGPLSLGMLYQIGWKFIRMNHVKHPDIEKLEDLQNLVVSVDSDYDLDSTKLYIISSFDDFVNADTVLLAPTETLKTYESTLPLTAPGTIKYYLSASNKRDQTFKLPGIAPEKYYSVTYGKDITPPTLTHQSIPFMRAENLTVEMVVKAKDNLGVNSVKVEYMANNNEPSFLNLAYDLDDTYKGFLTLPKGSLADGDSIRYRVIVEDKSESKNTNMLPQNGYYVINIEGIYPPVDEYVTDFNTANRDFISSDFSIITPAGFDDGALHSFHPYESPERENMTYEYVTLLKFPIIIKDGGKVSYDEVVLVEPAEFGAVFGSDEFWDYVIVEGSKDNGTTWLPLIDGYDSGVNSSWETVYNEGVSGNNSTSVGTKELFVRREFLINQKKNFEVGDTILIQFRLYSDAFANGWGWCIDNLNIQSTETSLADIYYSPGELMFYPNPVSDKLIFQGTFLQKTERLKLTLYNVSGEAILQKQLTVNGNNIREDIDMSNFISGLYLIFVEFENGQRISRKIVRK